jgi:hypothetical protein
MYSIGEQDYSVTASEVFMERDIKLNHTKESSIKNQFFNDD